MEAFGISAKASVKNLRIDLCMLASIQQQKRARPATQPDIVMSFFRQHTRYHSSRQHLT